MNFYKSNFKSNELIHHCRFHSSKYKSLQIFRGAAPRTPAGGGLRAPSSALRAQVSAKPARFARRQGPPRKNILATALTQVTEMSKIRFFFHFNVCTIAGVQSMTTIIHFN